MTSETTTPQRYDRLVLQAVTPQAETGLRSLLNGPTGFIAAGASREAIVAAVSSARDVVLCDPRYTILGETLDDMTWLPAALPHLCVGLVRVHWAETIVAGAKAQRTIRFERWAPDHLRWGICNIAAGLPGVIPTTGLMVIAARADWRLLGALLDRPGFGEPIRIGPDAADVEPRLAQVREQLARTRAAVVHEVTPAEPHVTDRILTTLADSATVAGVPRTLITLE